MTGEFPPGLLLVLGGLLVPLVPRRLRAGYMLALPLALLVQTVRLPVGEYFTTEILGYTLIQLRVDRLARVFAIAFLIATFVSVLYALHIKDRMQQMVGLVYAGSAVGGAFAGDLITLFIYWELATVSSVFLILARRTDRSLRAGMRYFLMQLVSGLLLLAGIVLRFQATGSLRFDRLNEGGLDLGALLILFGFGIKAAFPLLHNWLTDAYPEATVTGAVYLSVFTTKLAIYALARGFAGTEALVWVGATMACFPIFYAVIENDLRRVLAYSLINQLGFMVVGIGVGSELALNGTAAHAFAHILYKGLLFMSMGAVLHRVGTVKGSELGGLYKSMPLTTVLCSVGAASISAFPLFSGFATKALIIAAVMEEHRFVIWLLLLFASAGVFHHAGIKIPFFAFFAHDSGKRCKEAPINMLLAMGVAAAFCIGIGVYPRPLYDLLPFAVDYHAYTTSHVVNQLQLLIFAALAFATLVRTGIYPPELPSVNIDADWSYRWLAPRTWGVLAGWGGVVAGAFRNRVREALEAWLRLVRRLHSPAGALGEPWPTGTTAFWAALLLVAFLLLTYL